MTESIKIGILRPDRVEGMSQASIVINTGLEILLLGCHVSPSVNLTPIGNPKFQSTPNFDCRFGI